MAEGGILEMKYHCGSENCRKVVEDFNLLQEETRKKYAEFGITIPKFILDSVNEK